MHGSEAIDEESRIVFYDVVRRFKPGDEPFAIILLHFAKTDEGPHLMNVVPDRLVEVKGPRDVRINRDFEELRFAVSEPPDESIEQSPALIAAMERNKPRQIQKSLRYPEINR